jgi:predicted RecA/RadA family phage recombinase
MAISNFGPTPSVASTEPQVAPGLAVFLHGEQRPIPYTPSADTPKGTVVLQGGLVGVALLDIAANSQGDLATAGVFAFPESAADGGIAVGSNIYWDATNLVATTTAGGNTYLGKNELATAATSTVVNVILDSTANASGTVGFGGGQVQTVAAAGTNAATGTALIAGTNIVTGADATKGVTLPAASRASVVINTVANKVLPVYPNGSEAIDGGTGGVALSMAQASAAVFISDGTNWFTVPKVPA